MTAPGRVRPRVLRSLAGGCLVVGLLTGWPVLPAAAACAGPVLAVGAVPDSGATQDVADLPLGAVATVSGQWFHTGCDDTGQGSGCGAPPSEQAPMRAVALVLEQDGRSAVLATADAAGPEDRYRIRWEATVPAGFQPGPATLTAEWSTLPVVLTAP